MKHFNPLESDGQFVHMIIGSVVFSNLVPDIYETQFPGAGLQHQRLLSFVV
jgi:hypothetical protein